MTPNPYKSPESLDSSRFRWRHFWKRMCLGSLVSVIVLMLVSKVLAAIVGGARESDWFIILNGLLALGELLSFTIAGFAGIGWTLSRKSVGKSERPSSGAPGADMHGE